jgi:hypothetical protein
MLRRLAAAQQKQVKNMANIGIPSTIRKANNHSIILSNEHAAQGRGASSLTTGEGL